MAKTPRRVGLDTLDENLKLLINASAKIFPVEYSFIEAGLNNEGYQFVRVIDGEHRNNIYIWRTDEEKWELIGADDKYIPWEEIVDKPTKYPPEAHTHTEAEISDLNKYSKEEIDTLLATKSDDTHSHDELHEHANKSILDNITSVLINAWNSAVEHISDLVKHITSDERTLWNTVSNKADKTYVDDELATKSNITHNHDGRYYQKSEIDTKLNTKSDNFQNRTVLEKITEKLAYDEYDISLIYDLDNRLYLIENGYTEGHSHGNLSALDVIEYSGTESIVDLKKIEDLEDALNNVATDWESIEGKPEVFPPEEHTHTQADIEGLSLNWASIEGKPEVFPPEAHTHSEYLTDLPEHSHDEYLTSLPTHDHDERYNTKAEITTLLDGKANNAHSHAISDITNLQTSLNGKANINHTHISVGTSNGGADIWYKVIG